MRVPLATHGAPAAPSSRRQSRRPPRRARLAVRKLVRTRGDVAPMHEPREGSQRGDRLNEAPSYMHRIARAGVLPPPLCVVSAKARSGNYMRRMTRRVCVRVRACVCLPRYYSSRVSSVSVRLQPPSHHTLQILWSDDDDDGGGGGGGGGGGDRYRCYPRLHHSSPCRPSHSAPTMTTVRLPVIVSTTAPHTHTRTRSK
jgi:hypothetical protein